MQAMWKAVDSQGNLEWNNRFWDFQIVPESDIQAYIELGYSLTWEEAIKAAEAKDEPISDAPPTREELEIKAKDLGIKFDGRTTDKKLASLIEEALKG